MKLQTGLLLLFGLLQTTLAVDLLSDKVLFPSSPLPSRNANGLHCAQNNCGRLNHVCHENDGVATCEAGVCKLTCNDGWVLKNGICAESKAHKKQRLRLPLSLCPQGETACPIAGSKSFEEFKTSKHQISELLSAKGGYECLDTQNDLESCGGCAAIGEGRDCTKITNAAGIGCSAGQCIIFGCAEGYGLSLDNTECIKKASRYTAHAAHAAVKYGRSKP